VELAHLQSFLAVYRTMNVTRAAEELHLSQPAVTAHLRALESELKRPLFVRLPRGVTPTALGHQLANEIRAPLSTLDAVTAGFRPDAELSRARLQLGGPADFLSEKVLPLLTPLAAQGLSVTVQTGLTTELLRALSDGELDLVVATTPSRSRGVIVVPLYDETLALVLSPSLASSLGKAAFSAASATRLPDVLSNAMLIAFAPNAPLVRRYWRTVFGLSSAPKPLMVIDDLRAIARSVASHRAWSVLPTYLIEDAVRAGELVVPFTPTDAPTNTLYLATRTSSTPRPSLDRVVAHLVTSLR
jgi:DNA-binding transcriptional LysR family regulator